MRTPLRSTSLAFTLLGVLSQAAGAQTTIFNPPNGGLWDEIGCATCGQTFKVPHTDFFLKQFSFLVRVSLPSVPTEFRVQRWEGDHAGPVLFSEHRTLPGTSQMPPEYSWIGYDVNLALQPDQMYLAYLQFDEPTLAYGLDRSVGNQYTDGDAVWYIGSIGEQQYWVSTHGDAVGTDDIDAAFKAEFAATTVTPEPATLGLLALGLAGIAARVRRRRSC